MSDPRAIPSSGFMARPDKPLSAEVVSDSIHIISPAGVLVMTTDTAESARRYVMSRKQDLPGLRIERVTITKTVEAIYTPRQARKAAA